MINEMSKEFGYRFTFDTEEDQYGLLAICEIVRQCKTGSSENYSSHNEDARRIVNQILKFMDC